MQSLTRLKTSIQTLTCLIVILIVEMYSQKKPMIYMDFFKFLAGQKIPRRKPSKDYRFSESSVWVSQALRARGRVGTCGHTMSR